MENPFQRVRIPINSLEPQVNDLTELEFPKTVNEADVAYDHRKLSMIDHLNQEIDYRNEDNKELRKLELKDHFHSLKKANVTNIEMYHAIFNTISESSKSRLRNNYVGFDAIETAYMSELVILIILITMSSIKMNKLFNANK